MKRITLATLGLLLIGALAASIMAQDQRGRGGGGGRFVPGDGPGGTMGIRGGALPDLQKYETLRTYIDVVERFAQLANDPTASGVAAVLSASDLLRMRGPDAAIAYFNATLPDVKNEVVQRAIHIQLADLYRQANQQDKAAQELSILIKGAPAGTAPTTTPSR